MNKAILFDLDGVIALPEEAFSIIYTNSRGYDVAPFTEFFQTEWVDFVIGKYDIKQHIENNPAFWKWNKSPDELLQFWFESENVKNDALLDLIRKLRNGGVKCYIATEQEKYRTEYIRNVMFRDDFDGIFSTAEIGYRKNDPEFYNAIIGTLGLPPEDIIFFDDSESKVSVTKSLGIKAYLYEGVEQVKNVLALD